MIERLPRTALFPYTTLFRTQAKGRNSWPADSKLSGSGGPKESFRGLARDRKSTRLNSSHANISYAVFCLKKKKANTDRTTSITRDPSFPADRHGKGRRSARR